MLHSPECEFLKFCQEKNSALCNIVKVKIAQHGVNQLNFGGVQQSSKISSIGKQSYIHSELMTKDIQAMSFVINSESIRLSIFLLLLFDIN
jgi:hypothetical protein